MIFRPRPLALCALAALLAAPAFADEIELKSATALRRTLSLTHTFIQVGEEISKEAAGKLRIRYLGGPEVTPPNKVADALKRGLIDLLHAPASYYNGTIPEADAVLVADVTPAELRKNGGWDMLEKIWNKKLNAHVIAWTEPGFQDTKDSPPRDLYNLYFAQKPKIDPAKGLDLSGFKMRSTATYRELLSALGAIPVAMPNTEIYTAMQRGVVQGFGYTGVALTGLGLAGIVKYRVDPPFYKGNNLILANLDKWKSLPQELRTLIDTRFREAEVRSNVYVGADAKKETEAMQKAGMQIITLEGDAAKNYLKLANEAIWQRLEKRAPNSVKMIREKFTKQ